MPASTDTGATGYWIPVLFGFRGRIGRAQFALSMAYQALLTVALTGVFLAMAGGSAIVGLFDVMAGDLGQADFSGLYGLMIFGAVAEVVLSTAMFWSMRARMHDMDFRSGGRCRWRCRCSPASLARCSTAATTAK